jgi:hypothetical protein
MWSETRQIISIYRDEAAPAPSFAFLAPARIDQGRMLLLSEGSPSLEAKWTLTQVRPVGKDGETETFVSEYVCAMPDSHQNFLVIDVPDVEVQAGDRFDFSVNEPAASCVFVIECYASEYLIAQAQPEPEPEPVDANLAEA